MIDRVVEYFGNCDVDDYADEWGYKGPGWYFWDETWSYAYGPFKSEKKAQKKSVKYAESLDDYFNYESDSF